MYRLFVALFSILLLWSGCYQTAKIANQNLAFTYEKDAQVLHPHYSIYHTSPDKSQLHFSINTQELLYMKSPGNSNYSAKISVSYILYSSYESKQVLDSSSVFLEDDASKEEMVNLNGFFEVNSSYPNHYVMEVVLSDLNRNQSALNYVEIDKSTLNTPQNFKVTNRKSGQFLFRNQVHADENIGICYNKNSAQKTLYVNYFKPDFPLPSPPFSVQNLQPMQLLPDSTFSMELDATFTGFIQFRREGMYHFRSDTLSKEGLTLYVFHEDYPALTAAPQLVPPLRYLTTRQEHEALQNNPNKKLAVDNFWLNNCGNMDRAKASLKVYYNRVQNTNTYFSSYTEGWKTDRGLVYIAFGLPSSIYRDSHGETWMYGEEQNARSLTFVFSKVQNPYSENDYVLNRSENYRNDWFRMIDAWRQGKIINEK
ncbi:MAG: GWxTD domain-containing protein [Bacteroidetes bacterium]|nr:GWxTD domain-containing protein [Bacteroidota bacterium]